MLLYKSETTGEDNPLRDNIQKGLSVILSIITSLDSGESPNVFFPEFKTYWFSRRN
jgi:hypothetical protein